AAHAEQFKAAHEAHRVLSDAKRRAAYDDGKEAGDDIEDEALEVLLNWFRSSLDSDFGLLSYLSNRMEKLKTNAIDTMMDARFQQRRLVERRRKVRTKGGDNLFHAVIDRKIEHEARRVEVGERALQVHAALAVMIANYESDEDAREYGRRSQADALLGLQRNR